MERLFGGVGKSSSHEAGDVCFGVWSTSFSLTKNFLAAANLEEESECSSGFPGVEYSDLYRVGVLSVDIVRRGYFRALFGLFRSQAQMHTPATMTATGMATPMAIFAVPESPPEPEPEPEPEPGFELPPGLVPPGWDPSRRGF